MRALIIEDEEAVRDSLCQFIRSECFAVDYAEDGTQGSYMARTNEYDIIILDNMLPEKSGMQVCEEIRQTGKNVPILMLSVLGNPRQKATLINAGADDYMSKPFSFEELLARIRALLRRPRRVEGNIVTIHDLILDTSQQTVKKAGKNLYLTRKEFMLLEYLMRNQGVVLSRGMIMERVWDMSSDPFSNTIESHILSIRKKIGDKTNPRFIQTVPGRGYKIDIY